MTTDVIMPNLGLTMEAGTIVRWLVAPGQPVERGQPLFEVETDKVSVEVEALASGVLGPLLVEAGRRAPVGTVLARIGEGDDGRETIDDGLVAALRPTPAHLQSPTSDLRPPPSDLRLPPSALRPPPSDLRSPTSSPRARKIAKERGLDWRTLSGSGPRGRVIERDVLDASHFGSASHLHSGSASHLASHLLAEVDLSRLLDAHRRLTPFVPDLRLIDWLAAIVGTALDEAGIAAAIASAAIRSYPRLTSGAPPSLALIAAERGRAAPASAPIFAIDDRSASRIDVLMPSLAPAEIASLVLGRIDKSGHATLSLAFAGPTLAGDQAVRLLERVIDLIEEPEGLLLTI
ncbi:MAG: E3 binding domain-containing protein [Caldilineales bacterium]|nr:E3 binding domain-containing protein [Caldilineales bacterium]